MNASVTLLYTVLVLGWLEKHKSEGYSFQHIRRAERDTSAANLKIKIVPQSLGCFADQWQPRSLRNHYFNARGRTKEEIVQTCAEKAYKRSWMVFGIQWHGECWGDSEAQTRYNMYGVTNRCMNGLGGSLANNVYSIKAFCELDGYTYKIGELMYMPKSYSQISDASCNICKCGRNGPTSCGKLYCDLHRQTGHCEKWSNGPADGQCCPTCLCVHNGALEGEGSKWAIRTGNKCMKCVCRNGKSECESKIVVCQTCSSPVYVKGECCPICGSTSRPAPMFTLPPSTSGPFLPPFPPPPGH